MSTDAATRFQAIMTDAESLVRPDGTLEPGYEALALATFVEIVNAHRALEDDPSEVHDTRPGDPCPHPDCDLHLVWDPQDRMTYCTADWEHG